MIRRHLDWSLTIAAVAIGVLGYLIGDRTDWTQGYGFDGRLYGELATNWPSAVFGDGGVVPPGLGPYTGPHVSGLDAYYALRIVPSGLAWLVLQVLRLDPTHANVVFAFSMVNAAMFGLAMFCWCRSARLLGLGERALLLGAIALVINFAVLRTGAYWPVLTDHVAFGIGALSLYLWLKRATLPLVVTIVVGCFTWPLHVPIGFLLLLFPPPVDARERLSAPAEKARPSPVALVLGGLTAFAAIVAITYLQLRGYRSTLADQLPLFPLSVAIVGVYVFAIVAYLLPPGGVRDLVGVVVSPGLRRWALALGVIAAVFVGRALLTHHPGTDGWALIKAALWSSTLDPGLFAVVLVGYWGPILLLLLADLPRVATDARRLGPGMLGTLGVFFIYALTTQPREVVDAYPFALLVGVLAARRFYVLSKPLLFGFLGLSLLLSRVWLPIGPLGEDLSTTSRFPMQSYFMASGTWTSPFTYALQLVGVALIALALLLAARAQRSRVPERLPPRAVGSPQP